MVAEGRVAETLHSGDAPAVARQYRGQALHTGTVVRIKPIKFLYYGC